MDPYIKYWRSALQKAKLSKPRKITTPDKCAQQKIRMAETLLKSAFEQESKLFLAEFQKPDYMQKAASNYSDMHDRYWVENLIDFKNLVANKQEMDLKNQPEWQNSAFIYDGEVVSQDALGNINYGYFGSCCNIPQLALMAGAGYAQWRGGNWEWGFITTILDDPRDTYRVFQGIEIYEEQN